MTMNALWPVIYFYWTMGGVWLLIAALGLWAFWGASHAQRKKAIGWGIAGGLTALIWFYGGLITIPQVLVRQMAPGVYIDQCGKLVAIEKVPIDKGLPVIYQSGTFNGAGLARQREKWYFVVFLTEEEHQWPSKDLAVYRDDAWKVCLTEDAKLQLQTMVKHIQTDCWWKHDHPDKPVQAELKFLIWPTDKLEQPRIERWIFDS